MNPYLKAQREKYEALRKSIEGIQTRAAEASKDLTEDELRSVKEMGDQAKALYTQIEDLTEIETRNSKVAKLGVQLAAAVADDEAVGGADGDKDQARSLKLGGGAKTKDRDPGHYTRASENSFFRDLHLARTESDQEAQRRIVEHNRALSTGVHGPGVVPPKWLTEEFEELARQGRSVANAVRNIPLGDDPRPITLPKQIAGTDAVVAEQPSENTPVGGADAWDSDVDTVTPKPTAGKQTVSRQMLDMSSPAVDQLIYGDLMSVYNSKVEKKISDAIKAAGTLVNTYASEALFAGAQGGVVDLGIKVRRTRFLPATILAMSNLRYGEFLDLKDSTGRPIIPEDSAGPMNVIGVGSVQVDGRIRGIGVISTEGMAGATDYPDSYAAVRASDVLLFETTTMRFRFEEVAGPESIVLGIWGYTASIVRQGGKGVARATVTAAA